MQRSPEPCTIDAPSKAVVTQRKDGIKAPKRASAPVTDCQALAPSFSAAQSLHTSGVRYSSKLSPSIEGHDARHLSQLSATSEEQLGSAVIQSATIGFPHPAQTVAPGNMARKLSRSGSRRKRPPPLASNDQRADDSEPDKNTIPFPDIDNATGTVSNLTRSPSDRRPARSKTDPLLLTNVAAQASSPSDLIGFIPIGMLSPANRKMTFFVLGGLGALLAVYGLLSAIGIYLAKQGRTTNMLSSIVGDFSGMPPVMKRLALVQFFSWSALFIMWIYSGPIVSQYFYGSADPASAAYNDGANWWNLIYTVQNGVAAIAALFVLPVMARKFGQAYTHMAWLLAGALGFLGFFVLRDPMLLIGCEVLKGIAWASILAMPYAILASNLPQAKLGIYMGLFNIFIVVPQLLVATIMGSIMKAFFPGEPIWTMLFAAAAWALAALAMLRVGSVLPAQSNPETADA